MITSSFLFSVWFNLFLKYINLISDNKKISLVCNNSAKFIHVKIKYSFTTISRQNCQSLCLVEICLKTGFIYCDCQKLNLTIGFFISLFMVTGRGIIVICSAVFQAMGMEFKDKIMLYCLYTGVWYLWYVLGLSVRMYISGLMDSKSEHRCTSLGSFPRRAGYEFAFQFFWEF